MHFKKMTAICLLVLLPTQSVWAGSDEINLDMLTPHGSDLNANFVDEAVIGSWRLVKGQVETPAGVLEFRTAGRVLTVLASGSFQEDYSSETSEPRPATDLAEGQVFGAGVDRFAPKATCKIVATGLIIGDMRHAMEVNLDFDPPVVDAMTMRIRLNMSASTRPEVRCQGSPTVVGNMVSPPLGMGFTRTDATGPYVSYFYRMLPLIDPVTGAAISMTYGLEIWSEPSPAPVIRYYFVRN
jgi:hypothetical protein